MILPERIPRAGGIGEGFSGSMTRVLVDCFSQTFPSEITLKEEGNLTLWNAKLNSSVLHIDERDRNVGIAMHTASKSFWICTWETWIACRLPRLVLHWISGWTRLQPRWRSIKGFRRTWGFWRLGIDICWTEKNALSRQVTTTQNMRKLSILCNPFWLLDQKQKWLWLSTICVGTDNFIWRRRRWIRFWRWRRVR